MTNDALWAGIRACGPDKPFKGIGRAIHESLKNKPFCVSSQFSGHGIGPVFHSQPWIVHSANEEPGVMEPGHIFTIEVRWRIQVKDHVVKSLVARRDSRN